MKKIKIMIEIPSKWIDIDDPMFIFGDVVRQKFYSLLSKKVDEVMEAGLELPKIDPKEVEKMVIKILAERAVEKLQP